MDKDTRTVTGTVSGMESAHRGLSELGGASHDALVRFSEDIAGSHAAPDQWFGDHPVWQGAPRPDDQAPRWPIVAAREGLLALPRIDAAHAFVIRPALFAEAAAEATGAALSPAELQLLIDLGRGQSLAQSAEAASVAVNTRRNQLRSLFQKLGTSSQAETVALITQIAHRLTLRLAEALGEAGAAGGSEPDRIWRSYARHLPEGVRGGVIGAAGDAGAVRYLEIGPVSGRPVMMLHPMTFPDFTAQDVALCAELGLRTLWPVRPGCLSARPHGRGRWRDHCDRVARDIALLHDAVTEEPLPLVPVVSAAAYAVRYAELFPGRSQRIDFLATCFSAGSSRPEGYFFDEMMHKLTRNGRIAGFALQHLARGLRSDRQVEATARRIYGDSPADKALLDAEFRTPERRARFRDVSLGSLDSMRFDYFSQIHFNWSRARALGVPLQFWHGTEDRVNNLAEVTRLSRQVARKDPTALPDIGHLIQGPALRSALRALAADFAAA